MLTGVPSQSTTTESRVESQSARSLSLANGIPPLVQSVSALSIISGHQSERLVRLDRFLEEAALPVPQSQFRHLHGDRTEAEAKERMQRILDSYELWCMVIRKSDYSFRALGIYERKLDKPQRRVSAKCFHFSWVFWSVERIWNLKTPGFLSSFWRIHECYYKQCDL